MNELKMNEDGKYFKKGSREPFSGIAFHEKNGKRISQSKFLEGFREGEYEIFWPDTGKTRSLSMYKEGFRHGSFVTRDEEGVKVSESTYEEGSLEGPYQAWFPSGSLKEKGTYLNRKREGPGTLFFDEPDPEQQDPEKLKKMEEVSYKEGRLHGEKRTWDYC